MATNCTVKEDAARKVERVMNKRIAAELGVSEITVKVHRTQLTRKMRTRSLADLVRIADALGIRRDNLQRT